jgi:hypothetical protein
MSKRMYIGVIIGIVALHTWCAPNGVFIKENGYNWVNASLQYIIAGFFAVHGWPVRAFFTWLLFAGIFRFEWYCVDHDPCALVPPKWQWTLLTLRRRRGPYRDRDRLGRTPAGTVNYICPLNFFWGVVALYAFRTFSFPPGISRGIAFLGGKGFMIHFFDFCLLFQSQRPDWNRIAERSSNPWSCLCSMVLVTLQYAVAGFFTEVYRDRLLSWVFGVLPRLWNALRGIGRIISHPSSIIPIIFMANPRGSARRLRYTRTAFAKIS